MAQEMHPYLKAVLISALIFFSVVLIIVFVALYVQSKVAETPSVPPAVIEENLTPPGKLYPRQ